MRTLGPASLLLLSGCVQLVAFDQAIIGQPDEVPSGRQGAGLCDGDVAMGASALCTESCEIDTVTGESSCGERVALDGSRGTVDVSGLHEVELTVTACRRDGMLLRIVGENGATIALRDRSLHVAAATEANARPFEDERFWSASDEECEERSLLLQTGRMALTDSGRRLCSAHLVPVEGSWQLRYSRTGVRSIELCFRARS
ncbi:MAG: hypothetical protein KF729_03230 [Sandaracinaceae bacterium]|nr:hypothetical protein [Sandaracinaceae bacterium]